jgi:hypothetical protein
MVKMLQRTDPALSLEELMAPGITGLSPTFRLRALTAFR